MTQFIIPVLDVCHLDQTCTVLSPDTITIDARRLLRILEVLLPIDTRDEGGHKTGTRLDEAKDQEENDSDGPVRLCHTMIGPEYIGRVFGLEEV